MASVVGLYIIEIGSVSLGVSCAKTNGAQFIHSLLAKESDIQ